MILSALFIGLVVKPAFKIAVVLAVILLVIHLVKTTTSKEGS